MLARRVRMQPLEIGRYRSTHVPAAHLKSVAPKVQSGRILGRIGAGDGAQDSPRCFVAVLRDERFEKNFAERVRECGVVFRAPRGVVLEQLETGCCTAVRGGCQAMDFRVCGWRTKKGKLQVSGQTVVPPASKGGVFILSTIRQ